MLLLDPVTLHLFPKIFTRDSQMVRGLVNFTAVFGQCTADSLTLCFFNRLLQCRCVDAETVDVLCYIGEAIYLGPPGAAFFAV